MQMFFGKCKINLDKFANAKYNDDGFAFAKGGDKVRLNRTKVSLLMAKQLISQASLAMKAGISRQTMSAVMNGRNCRPELLGKISKALGVEPEEIIE